MPSTLSSCSSSRYEYKEIADNIIGKMRKELTRLLKQKFTAKEYSTEQWEIACIDYVQYLVAHEVGRALGMQTAPQLHVDALWQMHLLEESESYHRLEKKIIKAIKMIDPSFNATSTVKNADATNCPRSQLDKWLTTDRLYNLLGFEQAKILAPTTRSPQPENVTEKTPACVQEGGTKFGLTLTRAPSSQKAPTIENENSPSKKVRKTQPSQLDSTPKKSNCTPKKREWVQISQENKTPETTNPLKQQQQRKRQRTVACTDNEPLTINVRDKDTGIQQLFKVKGSTKMFKVFGAIARMKQSTVDSLQFMFDGNRIHQNDTPASLGLVDEDLIHCAPARFSRPITPC